MSCENCERLKDTNRRLNRRCQSAEAGLAAKISDHADTSFGRTLANAAATMYREQAEEAGLEIARLRAEVAELDDDCKRAAAVNQDHEQTIARLKAEVERWRELASECFAQGTFQHFYRSGMHNHLFISAYEHTQCALIDAGVIRADECEYACCDRHLTDATKEQKGETNG